MSDILLILLIGRDVAKSVKCAHLQRRAVSASVLLFLLVALVQSLLAGLADNTVWFGGLHALDGLAILAIAAFLYLAARRQHS